jgi:hypothetical protein
MVMSVDLCQGVSPEQVLQEGLHGFSLFRGAGVRWVPMLVETSLQAYAYRVVIVTVAVGASFGLASALFDGAIAAYHIMVPYALPAAAAMPQVYLHGT